MERQNANFKNKTGANRDNRRTGGNYGRKKETVDVNARLKETESVLAECIASIKNHTQTVVNDFNAGVDDDKKCSYHILVHDKKISTGAVVLNISLQRDNDTEKKSRKGLSVIITYDAMSNKYCTHIIDAKNGDVKVLFTSFDKKPLYKIEKYLPDIVKSTLQMIK